MTELKVGDKVRVADATWTCDPDYYLDEVGTVFEVDTWPSGGLKIGVLFTNEAPEPQQWFGETDLRQVRNRPTLADAIQLNPLTKRILSHMEKRGSISPMEALTSYGCLRLAAQIHKLRKAGWDVNGELRQDEAGHRYARYSLAA